MVLDKMAGLRGFATGVHSPTTFSDVVIVGGGMVGAALACAIGKDPLLQNQKVLVVERSPFLTKLTAESPYSNRVSSLSNGAVEFMKTLGIWKTIADFRVKSYNHLYVWDSDTDSRIDFLPNPDHTHSDVIAYMVENDVILKALREGLAACENVSVQENVSLKTVLRNSTFDRDGWMKIELDTGETISTRLLVGADGWQSRVRQKCGLSCNEWQYDQSAVVATLQVQSIGGNSTAWQRFLPNGPVALLPLSDEMSSLVWSTSRSYARELVQMEDSKFVDALNSALFDQVLPDSHVAYVKRATDLLGSIVDSPTPRQLPPAVVSVQKGSRACVPLSFLHAPDYVTHRVALVGDAAHRVHPLAGLGVNLGLGDALCLKELIGDAVSKGYDIGEDRTLLEYQSQRLKHNVPIMMTIDGLYRLYSTRWLPSVLIRSLGLNVTNAIAPIKNSFVAGAENLN